MVNKRSEKLSEKCMEKLLGLTIENCKYIGKDLKALHYVYNIWHYMSRLSPEQSHIYYKRLFFSINYLPYIDLSDYQGTHGSNSLIHLLCCQGKRDCKAFQNQQRMSRLLPIFSFSKIVFERMSCKDTNCVRQLDSMFGYQTELAFQTLIKDHFQTRLTVLDISCCEIPFEYADLLSICRNLKELKLGNYCEAESALKSARTCPLTALEMGYSRWLTPEKFMEYFLNIDSGNNTFVQYSSILNKVNLSSDFNKNFISTNLDVLLLNLLVTDLVSLSRPQWELLKKLTIGHCDFGKSEIVIALQRYNNLELFNVQETGKLLEAILVLVGLNHRPKILLKSIKLTPPDQIGYSEMCSLLKILPKLKLISFEESPFYSKYCLSEYLGHLERAANISNVTNMKLQFSKGLENLPLDFNRFPITFSCLEILELVDVNTITTSLWDIISLLLLCGNLHDLTIDFNWIESSVAGADTESFEFEKISTLKLYFSFFPKSKFLEVIINLFPFVKHLYLDTKGLSYRFPYLKLKCLKSLRSFHLQSRKGFHIRYIDKIVLTSLAETFSKENKNIELFASLSKNFSLQDIENLRDSRWKFY